MSKRKNLSRLIAYSLTSHTMPRLLLRLALAPFVLHAHALRAQDVQRASDIEQAVRANAARLAWPGFDPLAIPLAIFDGHHTLLFRHPAAPTGFVRSTQDSTVMLMSGRHPSVTANASAEIGARATATLLADVQGATMTADALSAVALHEAFHVFQRAHHRRWVGNEGDLLTYPVDDARRLALRRLESDALRRAQASDALDSAACWARAFVSLREARFGGLDSAFANYERLTELNEGLASYIQTVAARRRSVPFPAAEFAPAAIRLRAYTTGPAIAFLLDRMAPGWKASLERDDLQTLDAMLADAPAVRASHATCAHSEPDRIAAGRTAATDSAAIAAERVTRRAAFDLRTGWRVVVRSADGRPLWPQGFDPLNVERIDGGLLHARYLKVGNDAGSVEMIDEAAADVEAMTVAAGVHPLFSGVRQLMVVGFPQPEVHDDGGRLTISAPGLKLMLRGAMLQRNGTSFIVTINPAK